MTVDIARMNGNALAVLDSSNDQLARLGQWVQAAQNAHALVAPLIHTAFVPDAYRPKVDPRATPEQRRAAEEVAIANATAAVLQGLSLGVDPLVALQQIYIIHGRPGMYADFMVALLKSEGHEIWTEDLSDTRAVVCGRAKGSEFVERITVTMDQARRAGWTSNQAYAKTPQDMLYARAAGRVCKRVAPERLMGIASVEEIRDEIQATAEVGNGQRTVSPRRKPAAAIEATTVDDPPLQEEEPWPATSPTPTEPTTTPADRDEPTATPTPQTQADAETQRPNGTITAAQQRMLHALLRDTDRGDRYVALVYISGILGREIESTKELSKADAGKVIDALTAETAEPQPELDVEP